MKPSLFDFNGSAVRVVQNESGIWFIASDVCRVLELGNITMAIERLDEDERTLITIEGASNGLPVNAVNESGLYSMVLTSRKPAAKLFKKWVTSEVLPTIRQTGAYAVPGLIATNKVPANFVEALRLAADAEEQRQAAVAKLEEAAPKVAIYDRCMSSDSLFNFREVAAIYAEKGLGSNKLVTRLLTERVLFRDAKGHLLAYRNYIELGIFKAIERPYEVKEVGGIATGETRISTTLKVTSKGVEWIARKLGLVKIEELEVPA